MDAHSGSLLARFGASLDAKARKKLKALGHHQDPVVMVGQKGISPNLLENVEGALLAHELIKIKVHDAEMIPQVAEAIASSSGASLVQQIGKILLFYRAHPETPSISL